MKKLTPLKSTIHPISKKVIAGLQKTAGRKIIDISELRDAKILAENLEQTVITEKALAGYDPLHGVYVYAQNKLSVFIEQLAALPALSKLSDAYAAAEDEYMPSGPPASPLTLSYFSCWGFFDLCVGLKKETFATIVIDACRFLKADPGLIMIFELMQKSRMGFYVHEGVAGKFVSLREFVTGKEIKVIVPSGYLGKQGEIWLARLMPEPFPELNYGYSVVFTTPYVISEMQKSRFVMVSEEKWTSFFERTREKTKIEDKKRSYEFLMKYGLNRHYWNEYIFEGYVNHTNDMILLAGVPDISSSRPHSKENF
ncbi:MAG: hypothetical protein V2B19_25690 [Pseudomonadota bacterium]